MHFENTADRIALAFVMVSSEISVEEYMLLYNSAVLYFKIDLMNIYKILLIFIVNGNHMLFIELTVILMSLGSSLNLY